MGYLSYGQGAPSLGQGPFSVRIKRFDPIDHTMSAVTLQGHPLRGYRYWHAEELDAPDHVRFETGAIEEPGPGLKNLLGFYTFGANSSLKVWEDQLQSAEKDPGAHVYNGVGLRNGRWDSNPTGRVLGYVCGGASWCPQ